MGNNKGIFQSIESDNPPANRNRYTYVHTHTHSVLGGVRFRAAQTTPGGARMEHYFPALQLLLLRLV